MTLYSPSDIDLTRPDNVVQARLELERCSTVHDRGLWAEKWGRVVLDALEGKCGGPDELRDAKADLCHEEDRNTEVAE